MAQSLEAIINCVIESYECVIQSSHWFSAVLLRGQICLNSVLGCLDARVSALARWVGGRSRLETPAHRAKLDSDKSGESFIKHIALSYVTLVSALVLYPVFLNSD